MGFKDKLKEQIKGALTEDELTLLPSGFQSLGKVIILKLNEALYRHKDVIGNACLELFPNIKSVYINLGRVVGVFRKPEKIELIAGEDNPIVEHKEHGVIYRFDITKIMFSKGNLNERRFLATLMNKGDIVVDMFAGIGYFSLPIAKHSVVAHIYSIELNPVSYNFLIENININHFEDIITPINGDCKEEVLKLSKAGIKADHIIMGIFPAPKDYIEEALTLTKDEGSIFHYEGVVERENYMILFEDFNEIAIRNQYKCELKAYRYVKSFGPNLFHTVVDIFVS